MELYTIGEVCKLLDVKPHVLRYWEQEFDVINPRKDRGGKRQYSKADLNYLIRIRHLLYEEKYTIDGAKEKIWAEISADGSDVMAAVRSLRETLVDLSMKIDDMKKKLTIIRM